MTEEVTGTDRLRDALIARNSKLNLSLFAKDLGLSGDAVHGFITGGDLPPEQKVAIADYVFAGSVTWDPVTDRLMHAKRQVPQPQGVLPVLDPTLLPTYRPGACQTSHRPANNSPPDPKPKTRPGWLRELWW